MYTAITVFSICLEKQVSSINSVIVVSHYFFILFQLVYFYNIDIFLKVYVNSVAKVKILQFVCVLVFFLVFLSVVCPASLNFLYQTGLDFFYISVSFFSSV